VEAEERIDLFLQGKLEGKDLDIFRLRLQQDEVFAGEVETRKLIITALKESRHEELKAFIREATLPETKIAPFPPRKFIYAAVAASVIVGAAFLFFEQVINKKKNPTVSSEKHGTDKPIVNETPMANDNSIQIETTPDKSVPPVSVIDSTINPYAVEEPASQVNDQDDDVVIEINEDRVEVMQDRMIERKSSSDFLSEDLQVDTLLDLNEKVANEKHQSFNVELWESIIHFKGYKWNGKMLILYGIESFEKIQFHWVSNQLFLQRGKDYFLLKETNQFESYLKLTDQLLLDKLIK
jgi:hypothetical protein